MEAVNSKRTPSRCREWERARRNKFNEAISKLGEIVKSIQKSNCPSEDSEDVQYPKIEIIQKAIIYLNNYIEEKTHWKAEILALQVELDTEKNKKEKGKDVSTQVYMSLTKKRKDGKYAKLRKLKKSKHLQDKPETKKPPTATQKKLPLLLPRSTFLNKKGPENTIVVLPATPYIFPQRPLLFPSVPPAIVLIDQNIQPLNKSPVPIVNRNNGDITKTTMVNILPISAYSRPLSATKSKKNNVKLKTEINKKSTKKIKTVVSTLKETSNSTENKDKQPVVEVPKEKKIPECPTGENKKNDKEVVSSDKKTESDKNLSKDQPTKIVVEKDENLKTKNPDNNASDKTSTNKKEDNAASTVINKPKCTEPIVKEIPAPIATSAAITTNTENVKTTNEITKPSKLLTVKETISENKENKLPAIIPLDTTLCDNVVDGGNARLELAEEFLATSPTAAFLMSFPLVSGNRADSPAEEHNHSTVPVIPKDNLKRPELVPPPIPYFEKPNNNDIKLKAITSKLPDTCNSTNKQNEQQKCTGVVNVVTKDSSIITAVTKSSNTAPLPNVSENPFLNLSVPSIITTSCTLGDTTFNLDFDCNIVKSVPSQSTGYASSNNFFYKSDPFAKSTIYSTSSITSSHEFNGLGLYPCAMEKYASKNKSDYSSVDDSLMKIGSSRLTYDIDLGWSHKGLDFVNCTTTTNTFNKDTILTTTSAAAPYTTSYNPFNPDFHVPLVANSNNKKDNSTKPTSSFAETITSFYSQPANLWTEDVPFYTNNNMSKTLTTKNQNYATFDPVYTNVNLKANTNKHYEPKVPEVSAESGIKAGNNIVTQHIPEKYTKKSPSKMHINWMTSETRSVQNSCNPIHPQIKDTHKPTYNQTEHSVKKQDHNESNYFPITMHNFPTQAPQDEFQVWPSTRPLGTTEISIDPPPINLPTLVGDLALGPHDKNRKLDGTNRGVPHGDIQNCGNFLSVTQLMNRSTDNMASRYQVPNIDSSKTIPGKQNVNQFGNESNRKAMSHLDNHMSQPCYVFNDPKLNSYETMAHSQFPPTKAKSNSKTEKSSKTQKNNNYSTEALLRGANGTQKIQDSAKFMMPPQKYTDFSAPQDSAVAQVSHFPPILDYSDNSYATQQFSGTTLYNTTTNTMSNSFYSNFMPGSSNLMSSNYASGPFTGDYIDYNQTPECSYGNHKYEELKMRNNSTVFPSEKVPPTYKSSRRESATKHKLECSKKESSKKYQSKKAKINNEVEEWNDPHLFWQNKALNKKHPNLMTEELPFPNYVGNQMPSQYQADFFNSHLMPANMQGMGHNVDRSLASFPVTSRANFNLSTIFPEITMKVQ
ncbi:hypothetical protein PYW08_003750 [Mythimna loreyi]|uniref:Uncharacterized protein n=1 Tax=Mythimna loreyi TaxID=667449 RepID=A0ACC2QTS8_9NEOP|nr:hypothetical protein PYW08_003750 [Mythimna loreyi]